jgi:hypothetical protein
MTTMFEHLEPYIMPPSTHMPSGRSTAPSVQAVVVDRVSIVEPKLAPIIRDKLEVVMGSPENSQTPSPTYSKVITSCESRPLPVCVAIVHSVAPTSHVGLATTQFRAPTTLTKVVNVLPEEASPINGAMATMLKHFKPN